jgi:hypothetical protein
VRYYGWYRNASRGKRRKAQGENSSRIEEFRDVSTSAAKRAWARLIKQVYEVDPLVCSRCGGAMRILAFIEQPEVIDLPVPGTADREDPDSPGPLARPSPQPACCGVPVAVGSATGRAA